ncbi:MAG: hypothetical protein CMM07_08350 [Rhodopirellula sp.]|nr:hypothetical protein [Rhodopirellula sp.]
MFDIELDFTLKLPRCPFCNVDRPNLMSEFDLTPKDSEGNSRGTWRFYRCNRCGSIVTAWAHEHLGRVLGVIPEARRLSDDIPPRPKAYLQQALESRHVPSGAVMLAASAIDSMLKDRGYIEGNLYPRIKQAASDNVITDGMAEWAHRVRLGANAERHADECHDLPSTEDAQRAIKLAEAFAEFLYVLPAMVNQGLSETEQE